MRFDDAPKIIYGVAVRTREATPCEEHEQEGITATNCDELMAEGKAVYCKQARFRLV